jgi:hypothetical protein
MVIVHFLEGKSILLTQLLNNIPSVDENKMIKGRKVKVTSVEVIEGSLVHVHVVFEQVAKKPLLIDTKKKKR